MNFKGTNSNIIGIAQIIILKYIGYKRSPNKTYINKYN